MMKIDKAIQRTIEYAKSFGMKLDRDKLWKRLMGPKVFSKVEFDHETEKMMLSGQNKTCAEIETKMAAAKKMAGKMIKNDKNIIMVAITGSVAAENCQKNDDIDILTITREKRLWWSRLKLIIFLKKNHFKFRRYGKTERKNEFCFNMWLEEKALLLPKERQTERSAVDLILLKVLVNRDGIYDRFLEENDWAKRWIATGYEERLRVEKLKVHKEESVRKNIFGDLINLIAFMGQYIYMLPKITKETVRLKAAFFHVS